MATVLSQDFIKQSENAIPSLNLVVEAYEHKITGTQHFHLASDNKENVFLVGLKTVPFDSTGVAHILEHTALCGSKHYPVRDPFFMMIRRSLNTFMNAFTSSDWTAYPFASQNKKDFSNLLDVYLDAVFFSNLDELDFAQEGHRLEFEDMENTASPLVYKGVVFNEMKGAMSSPVSVLWQTLTKHIFPTNTYHYNSGGEPADIPDLTYAELKSFYQTHYHPSNALFFTYGDIPAAEHQARFQEKVLQHFEKSPAKIDVPKEQRYPAPEIIEEKYALNDTESLDNKTHVVLGWLLGESADAETRLKATLLSSVLLDNGSSPLRYALENTKLGLAPSPLCGLEDSNREMIFMCGIEGADSENSAAIEQMILDVLSDVAKNGVEQSRLDAALHQLELAQKEITGGSYPYGLQLILDMLPVAIHNGDTVSAIDQDEAISQLREKAQDPAFFKQMINDYLLDNTHRVRLSLNPDTTLSQQKDDAEHAKLAAIKEKLTDQEKQAIVDRSVALIKRQEQIDDESILPKVGVEDVPEEMYIASGVSKPIKQTPTNLYEQGTNGIVYQQVIMDLPNLAPELRDLLPLYTRCVTELGSADRNYLETQALMDQVTGGVSVYTSLRSTIEDVQQTGAYMILSGKSLARNHDKLADFMMETFQSTRFDEIDRIREIVSQYRASKENSITGNGHGLAMMAASAGMSPLAKLRHESRGLAGIKSLKALDDGLNDKANLEKLANGFAKIQQILQAAPRQILLVGEPSSMDEMYHYQEKVWSSVNEPSTDFTPFHLAKINEKTNQFWVTNTQVNFCSKAFPTVAANHEDSAALMVLGGFLKNGFLHRVVREQGGAYGGGAAYDSDAGAFRFYSYRDPRLVDTLSDFDRSIDWMLSSNHEALKLEEAILGVVSAFDKPSSPAGEAKNAFHNALFGRDKVQRQAVRKKVLSVTIDDLKQVTERYLVQDKASVALLSNQTALDELKDTDMEICRL